MATNSAVSYTTDLGSFYDAPNLTGSPERRLLVAILERAILDFVGNDSREIQGSCDWLFSDDSTDDATEFSFAWLCQQLDLDPDTISDSIRAMPKRGNHRIAPWYITKNYANKEDQQKVEKGHSNTNDLGDRLRKAS